MQALKKVKFQYFTLNVKPVVPYGNFTQNFL